MENIDDSLLQYWEYLEPSIDGQTINISINVDKKIGMRKLVTEFRDKLQKNQSDKAEFIMFWYEKKAEKEQKDLLEMIKLQAKPSPLPTLKDRLFSPFKKPVVEQKREQSDPPMQYTKISSPFGIVEWAKHLKNVNEMEAHEKAAQQNNAKKLLPKPVKIDNFDVFDRSLSQLSGRP